MSSEHTESGFTVVELSISIIIITILSLLITAYMPQAQVRSRDVERRADVDTLKNYFEQRYMENASQSFPTYPSTTTLAATLTAIQNSGQAASLSAPGNSSVDVSGADGNGDLSAIATTGAYIYQPFLPDGTLCTNATADYPCVRYRLWYKLEENTPPAMYIESFHQQ